MKAIPRELWHALVVADIDRRMIRNVVRTHVERRKMSFLWDEKLFLEKILELVVVVVDPTPPTCCQQSPAPELCGSQQSLPPGGKERLHFVRIRPEVQARKGGW